MTVQKKHESHQMFYSRLYVPYAFPGAALEACSISWVDQVYQAF